MRDAIPVSTVTSPLTNFIGRRAEIADVKRLLSGYRLVTLIGAGGIGKTRLALRVAADLLAEFTDGVCYVDLAPLSDPTLVVLTVSRVMGLPDQPGRTAMDWVLRYAGDRQLLVVLDNCEHQIAACGELVTALAGACPNVKTLATSREPLGASGEVSWRVPSLSLDGEAIELFADRARLVRPTFALTGANNATVTEICRRLDGMPLAIELAAARLRVMSPAEVLAALRDRFRLLAGGAASSVPRQQTLRASVDWSHDLLGPTERTLFRRLAVFIGGFDLAAVESVAVGGEVARDQILDLLTLLVDKSLVVVEHSETSTRYRMLETLRQYAIEKLIESGQADEIRTRHRDFYADLAAMVHDPGSSGHSQSLVRAAVDIDNLRAAFAWSRERSEIEGALNLASSLQRFWLSLGRVNEGLSWFDSILPQGDSASDMAPEVLGRSLADRSLLHSWALGPVGTAAAERALAIARQLGDQALLARALTARGAIPAYDGEPVDLYFTEAAGLARAMGDRWRLCQILGWQANTAFLAGDPVTVRAVAREGRVLAESTGDEFTSRHCRAWAGWADMITGDLAGAATQLGGVKKDARAARDLIWWIVGAHYQALALIYQGEVEEAGRELGEVTAAITEFGPMWSGNSAGVRAVAALAMGDIAEAERQSGAAVELLTPVPTHQQMYLYVRGEVAAARGDLVWARCCADEAVSAATGWYRVMSLVTRARVGIAQGAHVSSEHDAFAALALAAGLQADLAVPDILECLAATAGAAGRHTRSARLCGAADGVRRRMGAVRFRVHDAFHGEVLTEARKALGDCDFDAADAEGEALSTREAIAYARRSKVAHGRPPTGWDALTPAEREVVGLLREGMANKDIARRLLVSPRTVQTHLTHVYAKLGLASRVQLMRYASDHDDRSGID